MKNFLFAIALLALPIFANAQSNVSRVEAGSNEPVYTVVEHDPEFDGGTEGLYHYIGSNIKYPEACRNEKVQGRVLVSFVIETDGSVSTIKVLKSPDQRLSDEAVRVVMAMPKWKPGRAQGKKVRVQYTLPINFQL